MTDGLGLRACWLQRLWPLHPGSEASDLLCCAEKPGQDPADAARTLSPGPETGGGDALSRAESFPHGPHPSQACGPITRPLPCGPCTVSPAHLFL